MKLYVGITFCAVIFTLFDRFYLTIEPKKIQSLLAAEFGKNSKTAETTTPCTAANSRNPQIHLPSHHFESLSYHAEKFSALEGR